MSHYCRKPSIAGIYAKWNKCVFPILPPSLRQISILAKHIAISEYYKPPNGFLDSGGHQETGCEDFFLN